MTSTRSATSMKTLLLISTLTFALIAEQGYAFEFNDCSGKESVGKLLKVNVSCPTTGDYCPLVLGETVAIEVDFEALKSFNVANVHIYGEIKGISLPFPMNPSDACGNYGFDCPVLEHESKKLVISLPVLRIYPTISVTVQLYMNDEQNQSIVCLDFPAKIVNQV